MLEISKKIIPFLVFFIVANPRMFVITSRLLGPRIADGSGRPTQFGVMVHALVYIVLCHLMWSLVY